MTGSLDVTSKRTESNLNVRIGKSEAAVTNNKLHCTTEANYRQILNFANLFLT